MKPCRCTPPHTPSRAIPPPPFRALTPHTNALPDVSEFSCTIFNTSGGVWSRSSPLPCSGMSVPACLRWSVGRASIFIHSNRQPDRHESPHGRPGRRRTSKLTPLPSSGDGAHVLLLPHKGRRALRLLNPFHPLRGLWAHLLRHLLRLGRPQAQVTTLASSVTVASAATAFSRSTVSRSLLLPRSRRLSRRVQLSCRRDASTNRRRLSRRRRRRRRRHDDAPPPPVAATHRPPPLLRLSCARLSMCMLSVGEAPIILTVACSPRHAVLMGLVPLVCEWHRKEPSQGLAAPRGPPTCETAVIARARATTGAIDCNSYNKSMSICNSSVIA